MFPRGHLNILTLDMPPFEGQMVMKHEMKLGWGKVVPLPHRPVYIPAQLLEANAPPPMSGMPFNAQHRRQVKLRDVEHLPNSKRDKVSVAGVVCVFTSVYARSSEHKVYYGIVNSGL